MRKFAAPVAAALLAMAASSAHSKKPDVQSAGPAPLEYFKLFPGCVGEIKNEEDKSLAGGVETTPAKLEPGLQLMKSDGAADVVASVEVPSAD